MKPTQEIKSYLIALIQAEAYLETVRPAIVQIYNQAFDLYVPDRLRVNKRTGEILTDYKHAYLLASDSETKKALDIFDAEAKKMLIDKGFKPSKPEFCHLLEAESLARDLKAKFVEACCKSLPSKVLGGDTAEQFYKRLRLGSEKNFNSFLEINRKYFTQFIDRKELAA
jgi:hypothetical protein